MLKAILLNQRVIAGIGNIYADEICFKSGLHPESHIEKLKESDLKKIYRKQLIRSLFQDLCPRQSRDMKPFVCLVV